MSAFRGRTALVTGASGFIGSAVCRRLLRAGAFVHGVSRVRREGGDCTRWWQSSLADLDDVRSIVSSARPDVVFHFAGHVAGARDIALVAPTFVSSLTATVNLLTAATECGNPRVLLTGSLEEPDPEDGLPVPSSPYAAAKFAASAYARMFHALYRTPAVILRVFMVYGPGQNDHRKLIPYVTLSLLRGHAPDISSGRRPVDWIFIDDVVDAYLAAALAPGVEGRTLEIGTGRLVRVDEIVQRLVDLVDRSITPKFGAVADRPYEQVRAARPQSAAEVLGWKPRVELDAGLSRTVDWFRAQVEHQPR